MRSTRHFGLPSTFFSIAVLLSALAFPVQVKAQAGSEIIEISAMDAAKFIAQDKGRVVVVLVYGAYCPYCRQFFPGFLEFAGDYLDREVDVVALSKDETKAELRDYLRGYKLTFLPIWLIPCSAEELTRALSSVGITYGKRVPFVAVLDKRSRVVYEGSASIQALRKAVEASL